MFRYGNISEKTSLVLLASICFWTAGSAAGEADAQARESGTIRSVEFRGNRAVPEHTILESLPAGRGSLFSEEGVRSDSKYILKLYQEEGYIDACIDSAVTGADSSSRQIAVIFYITEGKLSVVQDIKFLGNALFTNTELLASMTMRIGNRFVPALLEKDIKTLLNLYDQKGYPLAKVSVLNLERRPENDVVQCIPVLRVKEGPLVLIKEIQVQGNTKTKDYVILREARLKPEELYTPELLQKVRQRVERLQLFSSVSVPDMYLLKNSDSEKTAAAGFALRVAEGNQNSFDGIVGYVPASSSGGEGYVTGMVSVAFRNLLGTGRKISIRWYRQNQSSQETEFHYTEPWVLSLPLDANVGLIQKRFDSTYIKNSYTISMEYMFNESFKAGGSFFLDEVFPASGYGQTVLASSRTAAAGLLLQYDARDDAVTPTNGIYYESDYQTGIKTTGSLGNVNRSRSTTQRVILDVSGYIAPVRGQVLAEEMHVRDFSAASIDVSDLFQIGGAATLRGYREGQFLGSRIVWLNSEYRFLVASRSFFYGFVDAAYIVQPAMRDIGMEGIEEGKVGYGIGVRFDSGIGLIGVCIALGEGDTFSTAKLHFRLTNGF